MSTSSTTDVLDYTQSVVAVLRSGTAANHEKAQNWPGARLLTGADGRLSKESYIRYLIILWHVYDTMENALDKHSSDPIISPTYNPRLLSRTAGISADIAYLLQTPESAWRDHPIAASFLRELPSEAKEYITSIHAASPNPSKMLAHAYIRYLGDLSGGQIIKRNIQKTFYLSDDDTSGVQMYQFEKLGGGGKATIGDMRTIKEWFRDGLNSSIGDDPQKKATLVNETRHAYRLNEGILSLLQGDPDESILANSKPLPLAQRIFPAFSITRFLSLVMLLGGLLVMIRKGGIANYSDTLSGWMQMQEGISAL